VEQFIITINQKLDDAINNMEQDDVKSYWDSVKSVITSVSDEVLRSKRTQSREMWFDAECQQANNAKNYTYLTYHILTVNPSDFRVTKM
jgi:hypothetical protein